jgi:hypothetical protein
MSNRGKLDFIIEAMYNAYRHGGQSGKGLSLSQISTLYRGKFSRQNIHENFKRRGYKLRSRKLTDPIFYKNNKYTPDRYGRYRLTKDRRKNRFLHHVIWRDNFGKIKNGYVIHHRDGNLSNNKIENLEMITMKESLKRRKKTGHNQFTPAEKLIDPLRSKRRKQAKQNKIFYWE